MRAAISRWTGEPHGCERLPYATIRSVCAALCERCEQRSVNMGVKWRCEERITRYDAEQVTHLWRR